MPYTVISGPGVNDMLAWIWLLASDRQAVSKASNVIDAVLKTDPLGVGTPHGSNFSYSTGPLTVL